MTELELKEHLSSFRSQVSIDTDRLEEECRYQPALYQEVGDVAAEARKDAKSAKEHVDFVKARLSMEMRANPSKFQLEKTTDKSIESAVLAHVDTREAIKDSIEAARVADSLSILQESIHQRRALLKCLVDLYTTNYFNTGDFTAKRSRAKDGMDDIVDFRNRDRDDDDEMEVYE